MPIRGQLRVIITPHAQGRAVKRQFGVLSVGRARNAILGKLQAGAEVNNQFAIEVPIGRGFSMICIPLPGTEGGGWLVRTVVHEGLKIQELIDRAHGNAVDKGFWDPEVWQSAAGRIMLIVTEVSEACEADRHGDIENFSEELADIAIRIGDLAGGMEIGLGKAMQKVTGIDKDLSLHELEVVALKQLEGNRFWDETVAGQLMYMVELLAGAQKAERNGDRRRLALGLANTLYFLFAMSGKLGIEIDTEVRKKMKKNQGRGYLHGKSY